MGNNAPKAATAPAGKKKTYKVLQNLRHDGKGYRPGSTVDLLDSHAAPLLQGKVVELAASEQRPAAAEE